MPVFCFDVSCPNSVTVAILQIFTDGEFFLWNQFFSLCEYQLLWSTTHFPVKVFINPEVCLESGVFLLHLCNILKQGSRCWVLL